MPGLNIEALEKALTSLELGLADFYHYPGLLTVRDGVMLRFEFAMDLAWKLLRRALRMAYQVEDSDLLSKQDIFCQAELYNLIDDAEAWIEYYDARNKSTNIYDSEEAQREFRRAGLFLADAWDALEQLRHAA